MEAVLQAAVNARRSQGRPLVLHAVRPHHGGHMTTPADVTSLWQRRGLLERAGRWDLVALHDARTSYEQGLADGTEVAVQDGYHVLVVRDPQARDDRSILDRGTFCSWLGEQGIRVLGRAIYTGDAMDDDVVETVILDADANHAGAVKDALVKTSRRSSAAAG